MLIEAIRYGYVIEMQEPAVIANPAVLAGLNSLLDNYGYVAPAPLPPQPPAGGDDEENGDGDGDVGATTTARPSGNVTNAPATSEAPQGATDDAPKKKGCKSSVGVVAVLVLGVSGAAVMLKKKDD